MCVVWYRVQRLDLLDLDGSRASWHGGLSLQLHTLALLLGFLPLAGVLLHSVQELFSRSGMCNVLDSDVDSLLDVSIADLFVNDDTNGGFGNVVDYTGLAVVDLERHTFLHGTVHLDVNDIANSSTFC